MKKDITYDKDPKTLRTCPEERIWDKRPLGILLKLLGHFLRSSRSEPSDQWLRRPLHSALVIAITFSAQLAIAQSISLGSSAENLGTLTTGGYHQTGSVAVTYNKGSFGEWSIRVYTDNTNGQAGLQSTSGDILPFKVWSPGFDAATSANTTAPLDPAVCPNWTRDWRFVTDDAAHDVNNKFSWTRIATSDANAGEQSSSPFNVRFAVDLTRFGIKGRTYSGTIVFELINSNSQNNPPTSSVSTTMTMDVTVSVGLDGSVTMNTGTMGSTFNLNSTDTRRVAGVAYATIEGEGFHDVLASNDVDAIAVRAFTTHASGKDGLVGETDPSQTIPFKIWTPNFGPGEGQGPTAIPDVDNDNNWKNEPNVRWFFVPDQSVTVTKEPPWNTAIYDHTNLILLSEAHAAGEVESGLQFIQNKSGVNTSQVPVCIDDRIPIHFAYELGGKATPQTYSTTVQVELAVSADGGATALATFPATINISANVTAVTPDITLSGNPASLAFPTQATPFGDRTIATGNVALSLDALGLHDYDAVSFRVLTNNGFDVNGEARNGMLGSVSHREDWTVPLRAWVDNFGLGVDGPDPDSLPDVDEEINWTGINRVWVDIQDLQNPAPPEPVPYEKALFNYLDMFKWNDADNTLDQFGDFQAHVPQHIRLIDRTADNGSDSRVMLHFAADFTDAIPQSYTTTVTVEAAFSSDGGANIAETRTITIPVSASVPGNGGDNLAWLKNRVDMIGDLDLSTGTIEKLAESFQSEGGGGDPIGFTYDQALAVMALTREGETAKAKEILNGLNYLQNSDGSFFFSYYLVDNDQVNTWAITDTNTNGLPDVLEDRVAGDPKIDTWIYTNGFSSTTETILTDAIKFRVVDFRKFTGTIAWVAMAATYYEKETGDATHAAMLDNVINYLKSIQVLSTSLEDLGAVPIGRVNRVAGEPGTPTVNGYFNTKVYAIEHNIDAYSAFRFYGDLRGDADANGRAQMARDFCFNTLWGPDVDVIAHPEVTGPPTHVQNAFFVGYNVTQTALASNPNGEIDDDQYLDPQSWGALSFGVNTVVDDKAGNPGTLALALDFLDEIDSEEWLDNNNNPIPARPFVKVTNQTIFPGTGAAVSGIDGYKERARERLYQLPTNLTGNFVWSEGSEGVVAALYAEGDDTAAAALHAETSSYTLSNGGVPYSTIGIPFNLLSLPGKENWSFSDDASIAGTTWYMFNEADGSGDRFNPFEPYVITAPPLGCSATVSSYPYSEGFEGSLGLWSQGSGDDINWTLKTGSTSSSSTGPGSANEGSYYVYTEASGSGTGYPNKEAILESPCFDLSSDVDPKISFDYHMYGSTMGTLELQITSTTVPWTNVWSLSGDQGNSWFSATVDLSAYEGQTVRFRFFGTTGTSYRSDMSVDNIQVFFGDPPVIPFCTTTIETFPYTEGFESGEGDWSQANGDDTNWTRKTGSTSSSNTGPTSANEGSYYMYVEASSPHYPGKTAIFKGPCLDLTGKTSAEITFDYHMYGSAMGTLSLQATVDEGITWTNLWSLSGDQGNVWKLATVDLTTYVGQIVTLRYLGTTGTSYTSDMSIDDISITVEEETNVMFDEDFNTYSNGNLLPGGANDWTNIKGGQFLWGIVSSQATPSLRYNGGGESMIQIDVTDTHTPQDFNFTVSTDVYFPTTSAHQAGVYFRYQDASNYYIYYLEEGQGATSTWAAVFGRIQNGGFTKLAGVGIGETIAVAKTYGLKVESSGSTYTFYVDKGAGFTQIMQAASSTFTDGGLGLRGSSANGALWDNVLVLNNDFGGGARIRDENPDLIETDELLSEFSLGDSYPNPFSHRTSIALTLPHSSPVSLQIFNLHGQLVKDLINESLPAGHHVIEWSGQDRKGEQVRAGMYFYRMTANGFEDTKRMVVK